MHISAIHRLTAKLALLAMLIVSLVPTLSIAFPMQQGKTFVQEVCSTQRGKMLIQIVTTQGQQLSTMISYEPSQKPVSLSHHLEHCPFCHIALDKVVPGSYSPAYVLFQQTQADISLNIYQPPVVSNFYPSTHTTRGPPLTTSLV